MLLCFLLELILLLKWKHNINKREEKTNERLVCKKTNLSWVSSISRLIYSLLHRRRRHSTCGAVSCPNRLIHLCASYVSLIRNFFSLSLFSLDSCTKYEYAKAKYASLPVVSWYFFFYSLNNVQEKRYKD